MPGYRKGKAVFVSGDGGATAEERGDDAGLS